MGPFPSQPCDIHISQFMTRDKPGSGTRCSIIDFSWPLQDSVKCGISKNEYLGPQLTLHCLSDNVFKNLDY